MSTETTNRGLESPHLRPVGITLCLCCPLLACQPAELMTSACVEADCEVAASDGAAQDPDAPAESEDSAADAVGSDFGASDLQDVRDAPAVDGATDAVGDADAVADGAGDAASDPIPDVTDDEPPPSPDVSEDPGPAIPAACSRDGALDCSPGPGEIACDLDVGPLFGGAVNRAIDAVIAAHPEWFDLEAYPMPSPGVVLGSGGDYVRAVAAHITAAEGLCAIQDPNASAGNEMGVKLNNACAESYNILTSWGQVRRPPGAHIATCWPGWF